MDASNRRALPSGKSSIGHDNLLSRLVVAKIAGAVSSLEGEGGLRREYSRGSTYVDVGGCAGRTSVDVYRGGFPLGGRIRHDKLLSRHTAHIAT
jgi:hypothetical protein